MLHNFSCYEFTVTFTFTELAGWLGAIVKLCKNCCFWPNSHPDLAASLSFSTVVQSASNWKSKLSGKTATQQLKAKTKRNVPCVVPVNLEWLTQMWGHLGRLIKVVGIQRLTSFSKRTPPFISKSLSRLLDFSPFYTEEHHIIHKHLFRCAFYFWLNFLEEYPFISVTGNVWLSNLIWVHVRE